MALGLVSSVISQQIGWGKSLQNELFCVEWDVKPQLSQSISAYVGHKKMGHLSICFEQSHVPVDVVSYRVLYCTGEQM